MYDVLIAIHSLLRWVVVLLGVLVVVRAFAGRAGGWTPSHDAAGKWYVTTLDIQMLVGLVLYGFLSPLVRAAFADMATAMRDPILRFYAIEHLTLMVIAIALAHVGRVRIRRAVSDAAKFRAAALFYTFSFLMVLLATPWPFRVVGRPWLPWV